MKVIFRIQFRLLQVLAIWFVQEKYSAHQQSMDPYTLTQTGHYATL